MQVLQKLGPLERYWTLHGGAAVFYHFQHRPIRELDFFCEPGTWDEGIFEATAAGFSRVAPPEAVAPFVAALRLEGEEHNVVKVGFQKVMFSFVKKPKNRGPLKRLVLPGMLPVASLRDALGGKLDALYNREALNDYFDIATALGKGYKLDYLLQALDDIRVTEIDRAHLFQKMVAPDAAIAAQLSGAHLALLRAAGEEGLGQL